MKKLLFIIIFVNLSFIVSGQEKNGPEKYLYIGDYVFEYVTYINGFKIYECKYVYTEKGLLMKKSDLPVPREECAFIEKEEAEMLAIFINSHRQELEKKYQQYFKVYATSSYPSYKVKLKIQDITKYQEELRKAEEQAAKEEKTKQKRLNSLENML